MSGNGGKNELADYLLKVGMLRESIKKDTGIIGREYNVFSQVYDSIQKEVENQNVSETDRLIRQEVIKRVLNDNVKPDLDILKRAKKMSEAGEPVNIEYISKLMASLDGALKHINENFLSVH